MNARGYRRPFVVADAFNADRLSVLGPLHNLSIFGKVVPEPDIPNLEAAIAAAKAHDPDLIIGFGGGSAMDIAKLVSILVSGKQSLNEIIGLEKITGRTIALAQISTTAGTGSEMGTRALVTDPATHNKFAVQSRFMLADIAIVDPDMAATVPSRITAETGIDAMAHCVEAFTNLKAHPLIDAYALQGIQLVGRYLSKAVANGSDKEARAGLCANKEIRKSLLPTLGAPPSTSRARTDPWPTRAPRRRLVRPPGCPVPRGPSAPGASARSNRVPVRDRARRWCARPCRPPAR